MHAQVLTATPVFQTKNKQLSSIEIDDDFHDEEERQASYIRVSKGLNKIDISLLDENSRPTGKYLRYQCSNTGYQYIGVAKYTMGK
ncbi:MAG: hypothetical protein RSE18_16180 [Acinetobacter sp.]